MKSKNSESFYITQSYSNTNGKSTSKVIRTEQICQEEKMVTNGSLKPLLERDLYHRIITSHFK